MESADGKMTGISRNRLSEYQSSDTELGGSLSSSSASPDVVLSEHETLMFIIVHVFSYIYLCVNLAGEASIVYVCVCVLDN